MRVVSTFHAPSTVVSSLKCRLSPLNLDNLVIAKPNRLEVYACTKEGLQFQCGLDIWGYVVDIKPVRRPNAPYSSIALTTDHPDPRILLIDYIHPSQASTPTLHVTGSISLFARSSRHSENTYQLVPSPDGRTIVSAPYVGRMRVTHVLEGSNGLSDNSDTNVREMNILSLAFLHKPPPSSPSPSSSSNPPLTLAILHEDYQSRLKLLARDIPPSSSDISIEFSRWLPHGGIDIEDPDSDRVIAIPRGPGLLVVGGQRMFFFSLKEPPPAPERERVKPGTSRRKSSVAASSSSPVKEKGKGKKKAVPVEVEPEPLILPLSTAAWPYSNIVAHCLIDTDGSRILFSDKFGKLVLLTISPLPDSPDSEKVQMDLHLLGSSSPASTLTYLTSGVVYLGSHLGNHVLLQLTSEKQTQGGGAYFRVIETWNNIAPVMDACLIGGGAKEEDTQIVTASGGGNTGSLRLIRSGAEFQQLAILEDFPSVGAIWGLKERVGDPHDTYLLCSTSTNTRVLNLTHSPIEEEHDLGLDMSTPTLACSNFRQGPGERVVVQVTRSGVRAVDLDMRASVAEWKPGSGERITVASASETHVCVALAVSGNAGGNRVVVLTLGSLGDAFEARSHSFEEDISAISCVPFLPSSSSSSHALIIGFWGSNTVKLFQIHTFAPIGPTFTLTHIPRSVLVTSFGVSLSSPSSSLHLFVGLGDGSVFQAVLDGQGKVLETRSMNMGHRPVRLSHCQCQTKEGWGVLASGERASVVFKERGRVRSSPLSLKGITGSTPFNSEMYPGIVVFSTATGLVIGCVKDVQKLYIRTIPLGLDCPQRLSHHAELGVLGVGTLRTEPHEVGGMEESTSVFHVYDDQTLHRISSFRCKAGEEVYSVSTVTLTLTSVTDRDPEVLPDADDEKEKKTFFCVGTVFLKPNEVEPSRGRILLFDGTSNASMTGQDTKTSSLVAMKEVPGCVYQSACIRGLLVAAINTGVMLFAREPDAESRIGSSVLKQTSEINHNYLIVSLVVRDEYIFIADTFNSITLLNLNETERKLHIVAKCYTPNWPISLQAFDRRSLLGADGECNLFTYRVAERADGKLSLENEGLYHVGEMINKFLPGSLVRVSEEDRHQAQPRQLFFTSVGRIGVLSDIPDDLSLSLTELQRNLSTHLKGAGGVDHVNWRRPNTRRGPTDVQAQAFGYVDGDFLEQYLLQSDEDVGKIRKGTNDAEVLKMSHQDIIQVLEKLQMVH